MHVFNIMPELPLQELPKEETERDPSNHQHLHYLRDYLCLRKSFSLADIKRNKDRLLELEQRLKWDTRSIKE